jgi:rRNA maturation endonuclease Nob1
MSKRTAKYPIRCSACGSTHSYTLKAFRDGVCRECGKPLQGTDYDAAQAHFATRRIIRAGKPVG